MSRASARVLCLDIEGGFGGSSRSLYESLRHIDRTAIAPEVWCRRDGPIQARYTELAIPCRVAADMPRMNTLRRASRNLLGYARVMRDILRHKTFRHELLDAITHRFDAVHFNHEGLFLLSAWLRRRHSKAQTMHVRTMIPRNNFGRWQCRRMAATQDRLVFITENERANFEAMLGRVDAGTVIYNVAHPPGHEIACHPAVPKDERFKVAVLSNYSWIRGADRMVDVARELAERGRRDVLFVVAGDMRLHGDFPGQLGNIARAGGSLSDYATARGVAGMFLFLGHVAEPETVLVACDVLAKPTRGYNPWGRDIIEALAAGKPALSIGRYDRFVETSVTGFLFPEFDSAAFADAIADLADDREMCARLGQAAAARVARLCHGPKRASELVTVWQDAISVRCSR